jgi:hypothetical protein
VCARRGSAVTLHASKIGRPSPSSDGKRKLQGPCGLGYERIEAGCGDTVYDVRTRSGAMRDESYARSPPLTYSPRKPESIDHRHADVREDDVRHVLVDFRQRLRFAVCNPNFVAEQGQQLREPIGHVTDVVDHEDVRHLHHRVCTLRCGDVAHGPNPTQSSRT